MNRLRNSGTSTAATICPHRGARPRLTAACGQGKVPVMTSFQRLSANLSTDSYKVRPAHGAALIGDVLASALRALPQPANDILRPIAEELETR